MIGMQAKITPFENVVEAAISEVDASICAVDF